MTLVVQTVQDALRYADDRGVNWELVDMCGAVLLSLSNASLLPMATLIEYIDGLSLVSVLCTLYAQPTQIGDGQASVPMEVVARAWTNIVDLLVHCTTCQAPNCHYIRTEAYLNALRRGLEANDGWTMTMDVVFEQARVSKDQASMDKWASWTRLGKGVGMSYTPKLRPSPKTCDGCWEETCERHGAIDEVTEGLLQRCSGCKRARYCSGGCQTRSVDRLFSQTELTYDRDWNRHKTECKQMRDGR